jgi:hypothetical protein
MDTETQERDQEHEPPEGVEVTAYYTGTRWDMIAARDTLAGLGFFGMGDHQGEAVFRFQVRNTTPDQAIRTVIEGVMSIEGIIPYDVHLGPPDEKPGDQDDRTEAFADSLPEDLVEAWWAEVDALVALGN